MLGYGWTGKGVALRARGAGAQVIVCEVDPMRALEARMEGFEVMPALEAAARGDVFVTVTGNRDVLSAPHFARMKDGAVLANAGHFDVEIDLPRARAPPRTGRRARCSRSSRSTWSAGRRLNLLASGRVVNLAAGQGHPAAVMDMSFANQALAVEHLVRHGAALGPGVHPVPEAVDREVARLKLASLGVAIDALSERAGRLPAGLARIGAGMSDGLQAERREDGARGRPRRRDRHLPPLLRAARGRRVGHGARGHDRARPRPARRRRRCRAATPRSTRRS